MMGNLMDLGIGVLAAGVTCTFGFYTTKFVVFGLGRSLRPELRPGKTKTRNLKAPAAD